MFDRRLGAALVAAALAAGGEAAASGYALREQSAVGQGTSFAGATARAGRPLLHVLQPGGAGLAYGYQAAVVGSYIRPESTVDSGFANRTAIFGGSPHHRPARRRRGAERLRAGRLHQRAALAGMGDSAFR
jgi:long-chain fatty acid transport protein